jgi:hypothetical protein
MVVGPEAAGSLLVGTVVKSSVDSGAAGEGDDEVNFTIFAPYEGLRAMETSSILPYFPPLSQNHDPKTLTLFGSFKIQRTNLLASCTREWPAWSLAWQVQSSSLPV